MYETIEQEDAFATLAKVACSPDEEARFGRRNLPSTEACVKPSQGLVRYERGQNELEAFTLAKVCEILRSQIAFHGSPVVRPQWPFGTFARVAQRFWSHSSDIGSGKL